MTDRDVKIPKKLAKPDQSSKSMTVSVSASYGKVRMIPISVKPDQKALIEMDNENMLSGKKEVSGISADGPKGVGGWLALLIIVLTVLSPVANIVMVAKEFYDIEMENPLVLHISSYVHYKWFCWGAVLIASAISIAAGYLLWKKHEWKSVRLAIGALWIIGPFSVALVGLYFYVSFGSAMMSEFLKDVLGTFAKSVFWVVVWTAYLLRSKRVKNTFVRESA